jgi:hypothetical protein
MVLDIAGQHALAIEVPNLGVLPWEAVIEFRDHPGSEEARQRLREFELKALNEEPQDATEFLLRISQEIVKATNQAWDDQRTKLPQALLEEAAKATVSLLPFVGPPIATGASIAHDATKAVAEHRTWIAALMTLNPK